MKMIADKNTSLLNHISAVDDILFDIDCIGRLTGLNTSAASEAINKLVLKSIEELVKQKTKKTKRFPK